MLQVQKSTTAFYSDKQVPADLVLCARRDLDLDAVSNRLTTLSDVIHQQTHQWRHLCVDAQRQQERHDLSNC